VAVFQEILYALEHPELARELRPVVLKRLRLWRVFATSSDAAAAPLNPMLRETRAVPQLVEGPGGAWELRMGGGPVHPGLLGGEPEPANDRGLHGGRAPVPRLPRPEWAPARPGRHPEQAGLALVLTLGAQPAHRPLRRPSGGAHGRRRRMPTQPHVLIPFCDACSRAIAEQAVLDLVGYRGGSDGDPGSSISVLVSLIAEGKATAPPERTVDLSSAHRKMA
jgi:hypothetical protein